MKLAVQRLLVRAPAQRVFELFTDPEQFSRWMAPDATLDPTPSGAVRWTHPNGDTVSGHYVDIEPPSRIVFTYGWERAEVGIPPGSTTVEIDLIPQPDGSTLVTLVHRGLEDGPAEAHQEGWAHHLDRMRRTAHGEQVGAGPALPSRERTVLRRLRPSQRGAGRQATRQAGSTTSSTRPTPRPSHPRDAAFDSGSPSLRRARIPGRCFSAKPWHSFPTANARAD